MIFHQDPNKWMVAWCAGASQTPDIEQLAEAAAGKPRHRLKKNGTLKGLKRRRQPPQFLNTVRFALAQIELPPAVCPQKIIPPAGRLGLRRLALAKRTYGINISPISCAISLPSKRKYFSVFVDNLCPVSCGFAKTEPVASPAITRRSSADTFCCPRLSRLQFDAV